MQQQQHATLIWQSYLPKILNNSWWRYPLQDLFLFLNFLLSNSHNYYLMYLYTVHSLFVSLICKHTRFLFIALHIRASLFPPFMVFIILIMIDINSFVVLITYLSFDPYFPLFSFWSFFCNINLVIMANSLLWK